MTTEQKQKNKFRQSAKWKRFRAYMKKKYKVDAITGKPLRPGWQLHHMREDWSTYKDLDEKYFLCLNQLTHKALHWLERYDKKTGELLCYYAEQQRLLNSKTTNYEIEEI